MSSLIQNTFPIFTDVDGNPLEDGYIYIGQVGLDPIANPIQAYWDKDLTVPANNIRTKGGYPNNSGTPGRIFVGTNYSILVHDKRNAFITKVLDAEGYVSAPTGILVSGVAGEAISQNEAVYFSTDGKMYKADSTDVAKSFVSGVAISSVALGEDLEAQKSGTLTTFSGLTVGEEYFLGTSGALVLESALADGDSKVSMGIASAATTIDLNVQPPISEEAIQTGTLGETVTAGDIVYYATDGKLYIASKDDVVKSHPVGIATQSGVLNDVVRYQKTGKLNLFSGLSIGGQYYLGNSGVVVSKANIGIEDVTRYIGTAISTTEIDVNLQYEETNLYTEISANHTASEINNLIDKVQVYKNVGASTVILTLGTSGKTVSMLVGTSVSVLYNGTTFYQLGGTFDGDNRRLNVDTINTGYGDNEVFPTPEFVDKIVASNPSYYLPSISIGQTAYVVLQATGALGVRLPSSGTYAYSFFRYDNSVPRAISGSSQSTAGDTPIDTMATSDNSIIVYRRLA